MILKLLIALIILIILFFGVVDYCAIRLADKADGERD